MLNNGSSSDGEEEQWKVAPFDKDILRGRHDDSSGEEEGEAEVGRLALMTLRLRR